MSIKIFTVLVFIGIALLISCAPPKAGSAVNSNVAPTASQKSPSQSPVAQQKPDGAAIFADNCAGCHGDHGEGARKGISLISGNVLKHSPDDYIDQINDGTEKKMPSFRDKLSPQEINAVVNHVRNTLQSGVLNK